eukprot:7691740-Heterocapsa_arctica.AAC.1
MASRMTSMMEVQSCTVGQWADGGVGQWAVSAWGRRRAQLCVGPPPSSKALSLDRSCPAS